MIYHSRQKAYIYAICCLLLLDVGFKKSHASTSKYYLLGQILMVIIYEFIGIPPASLCAPQFPQPRHQVFFAEYFLLQ